MTTDTNTAAPSGDRRGHIGRASVIQSTGRPPTGPPVAGRPANVGRATVRPPAEDRVPHDASSYGRHGAPPGTRPPGPAGRVPGPPLAPAPGTQMTSRLRGGPPGPLPGTQMAGRLPGALPRPAATRVAGRPPAPPVGRPAPQGRPGTYVADTYHGDIAVVAGGAPALAHDGEPAGLARVTSAMRDAQAREAPAPGQLVALCAWAAVVALVGVVIGARSAIEVLVGAPSWFLPESGAVGFVGVACTVVALFIARRGFVPWALLAFATCALGAAVYLIELADTARAVIAA